MPQIPVLQFVLPFAIFFMMTIMYVAICLFFQRARRKRRERLALQAQAREAVYVIPISVSEEDVYRPPRYSTVQFYEPPPAYHELQIKPDVSPPDLPPAYSESISSPAH